MNTETTYNHEFFSSQSVESLQSAKIVVPFVIDLVRPKSVVDVGCGIGTWLSVFKELGIDNIKGLDGDYVDRSMLLIPEEDFCAVDLSQPFSLEKSFNLAISLEVAEHIPQSSANSFVQSLVSLAPLVLFSAAIPYQSGRNHLNAQWSEYWKQIFLKHKYVMFDPIRKLIFNNDGVVWWYRQNIFMFASADLVQNHPAYRELVERNKCSDLLIVHPNIFMAAAGLRVTLQRLPMLLLNRVLGIRPKKAEPWYK